MNLRSFAAPVLVAALLTGCSAGTDTGNDTAQAPTPGPAGATATPAQQPSSNPIAPRLIDVTYSGGQITTAEPRVEVRRGEAVLLRITSDVAEEVHVHGYDLVFDVPAGSTVNKMFNATLPGQWEVELHEAGRPMFVLKVT